jgi:hypothetical protein
MTLGGRAGRGVLLLGALAAALALGRGWPHDQTIQFVLGGAAPRVEQLEARWARAEAGDDSLREVSFRFVHGTAPRVVTDPIRMADGDYVAEITIVADGESARVERRVKLGGGVTSIDLAARVPRGPGTSNAATDTIAR